MPAALFIPPTQYLVHQQISLAYNVWLHTELINNLGPLEWIFTTPKHHRIHHGIIHSLHKNKRHNIIHVFHHH